MGVCTIELRKYGMKIATGEGNMFSGECAI